MFFLLSVFCVLNVFLRRGLGRKRIWTPPSFNVHLCNSRVLKNAAKESTSVSFCVCVCVLTAQSSDLLLPVRWDHCLMYSFKRHQRCVWVCVSAWVCVCDHTLAAATDRSSVHWHIIIISSFSTPGIFSVIGISLLFWVSASLTPHSTFSTSRFLSFISPFFRLFFPSTASFFSSYPPTSSIHLGPISLGGRCNENSKPPRDNLPETPVDSQISRPVDLLCLFVCFQCPRESSPLAVKHHII